MSDGEIFPLSITDLAGTTLDLGSVRENDTVATVRRRVADLWGVAVERVDLLHNSGALADADHHRVVRDVFTVDDTLLAARQPCRARPTDYPSHILSGCGFVEVCHVSFPAPKDININMMPFIFGDESSLPEECRGYWEMTQRCRPRGYYRSSEDGKVCFLTIQEGMVEKGLSQRRPGVHVERSEVEVKGWRDDRFIHWGGGGRDQWEGGLYVASSVDSSTKIWNATVTPEIVGDLGSVQHIEDLLGDGETALGDVLVWMTDLTPHESVVFEESGYRQFFRLVTSDVTHWYAAHSTANPLGIVPDPEITQIVFHNKFGSSGS